MHRLVTAGVSSAQVRAQEVQHGDRLGGANIDGMVASRPTQLVPRRHVRVRPCQRHHHGAVAVDGGPHQRRAQVLRIPRGGARALGEGRLGRRPVVGLGGREEPQAGVADPVDDGLHLRLAAAVDDERQVQRPVGAEAVGDAVGQAADAGLPRGRAQVRVLGRVVLDAEPCVVTRGEVEARGQERLEHGGVSMPGGPHAGGAARGVPRPDLRLVLDEHLHHLGLPRDRGPHERRPTLHGLGLEVHAALHKQGRGPGVAARRREVEGRVAALAGAPGVRPRCQERLDQPGVPGVRHEVQRRPSEGGLRQVHGRSTSRQVRLYLVQLRVAAPQARQQLLCLGPIGDVDAHLLRGRLQDAGPPALHMVAHPGGRGPSRGGRGASPATSRALGAALHGHRARGGALRA
mmetsp:Transcript_30924/g.88236  ORF Transcript_30924/g.88236 Transcript_30924/m.88236 type:complete len:404 (+) Transcript_30924:540-1751(+)